MIDSLAFQTTRMNQFNSARHVQCVAGTSVQETTRTVQAAGISLSRLPTSMGGQYHRQAQFADWVRMCSSMKDIMSASDHPLSQPRARRVALPVLMKKDDNYQKEEKEGAGALVVVATAAAAAKHKQTSLTSLLDTDDDNTHETNNNNTNSAGTRQDVIRQRKAASARRAYHKQKLATLALQEQVRAWQMRNAAARSEQVRLQPLLEQAQKCVVMFESAAVCDGGML